jgi:hypothetical protein
MGVMFEFDIPKAFRLDALRCLATIPWSGDIHPSVERIALAIAEAPVVVSECYLEHHNAVCPVCPVSRVRVDIADTGALEVVLSALHAQIIDAPLITRNPDEGDESMQLDWEGWSWDALHMLHPFRASTIVDFIGDIDRCAVERLIEAAG